MADVDEVARSRWEKSLRELRQEKDQAYRAWRREGGYYFGGGRPTLQPDLFKVLRDATQSYYEAAAECYPRDLDGMLRRVSVGDRSAIDDAIAWLEADYFTRWTGFMKQKILCRLCQAPLTEGDKDRLRGVVLAVCARGPRQEFREVRKLSRRKLASPAFAAELRHLAESHDSAPTRDAALMLLTAVEAAL